MKGETPDEILRNIVSKQPPHETIERASHLLHLESVIKMLAKYGENDLIPPIRERLEVRRLEYTADFGDILRVEEEL